MNKHQIQSVLSHGVIVNGCYPVGSYVQTPWGKLKVVSRITTSNY